MAKNLTTGLQRGLRQSIAGGLGTGDLFSTASLDLQFARHKSLDSRVTHTRQSSATYVDGDGVIRTAVTNLATYSEDFNQWTQTNVDLNPDQVVAPDGTLTADEMLSTSGVTGVHRVNGTYTFSNAGDKTISVYVKNKDAGTILINLYNSTDGNVAFAYIDLSDFSVSSGSATVSPVGNGWHRISLSGSYSAVYSQFFIQLVKDGNNNFTGDGTGIYLWGAQLEESSTVGQYVKTTTAKNGAPRFDHDPTTGESLGLLVEESRQNLLTYSEDLTGYNKLNVTTPFDSSVINPTGSTGSYKILADSGLSTNSIRINKGASSANNIAVSAFVKKSTYRYVLIGFGGLSNSFTALFDIEPGLTSNRLLGQGGKGTYTNIDAGYQNFPNDWIRIWAVGTTSGTDGFTASLSPDATTLNITNWTAAGTEEIYAWGLQYEDNVSFPTSYIPTEGSTVTRAADVASISGSNFSSWYNDNEGSGFIEAFTAFTGAPGANFYRFGSYNNGIRIARSGSGATPQLLVTVNSATQGSPYAGFLQPNVFAKIIAAYKVDDFAISTNGSSPSGNAVETSGSVPQGLTSAVLMDGNFGCVRRFTYWPQRLPNDTLQTITA